MPYIEINGFKVHMTMEEVQQLTGMSSTPAPVAAPPPSTPAAAPAPKVASRIARKKLPDRQKWAYDILVEMYLEGDYPHGVHVRDLYERVMSRPEGWLSQDYPDGPTLSAVNTALANAARDRPDLLEKTGKGIYRPR